MRDFKGMKRQRNRGRGGGGGKPQQNANRAFDSNGPDGVKVRGAAQHIYEKYQQLARDAGSSGDRVLAENYLQHAEHYFRVLRAMQPQRPVGEIIGRDQFASGYDIDFEEEPPAPEETVAAEPELDGAAEPRRDDRRDDRSWQRDDRQGRDEYRQRDDRQRDDRQRDEYRQRDDRPRDDRPRDDRSRDDRSRDDRSRDDRQGGDYRSREDRPRDDRPRDDRPRDDRPRDDRPRDERYQGDRRDRFRDERQGRYQGERPPRQDRDVRAERDPLSVIEPQATPLPAAPTPAPAQEPVSEPAGDVLRGEDGAMSHAPAFLQARPDSRPEGEEGGDRRPRRRRPPRNFEGGETSSEFDEG